MAPLFVWSNFERKVLPLISNALDGLQAKFTADDTRSRCEVHVHGVLYPTAMQGDSVIRYMYMVYYIPLQCKVIVLYGI